MMKMNLIKTNAIYTQFCEFIKLYFFFQSKVMANDQQMRLKSQKHYNTSIDKSLRIPKKQQQSRIGPILLGVFLFVIVGSTLFQILNVTNQSGDDILI